MFCTLYKWLISQAADSGKPISTFVKNHTHRCDSCREFAQLCESLKPKFAQDKQSILENTDEVLNKKIIAALSKERVSLSVRKGTARKFLARKPALVASLAGVFMILAISLSIIFLVIPHARDTSSFGRPSELVSVASPEVLLVKAESPLEKEYLELKKTFSTTTEYLRSVLDFHIGEETE
ncbi:MAG: hypothetical protein PVF66_03420 [Candidatus Aminicenantes bacterium]|jgi:hypothetical protein